MTSANLCGKYNSLILTVLLLVVGVCKRILERTQHTFHFVSPTKLQSPVLFVLLQVASVIMTILQFLQLLQRLTMVLWVVIKALIEVLAILLYESGMVLASFAVSMRRMMRNYWQLWEVVMYILNFLVSMGMIVEEGRERGQGPPVAGWMAMLSTLSCVGVSYTNFRIRRQEELARQHLHEEYLEQWEILRELAIQPAPAA